MISQVDELKELLAPKIPELGLDDGTVENILSKAADFSEKELKPHTMEWDEKGTHFEKIYRVRIKNKNIELGENEYSLLDKYGCIDEAILAGRRLSFPEHFEEAEKKLGKTGLLGLLIPEGYGGLGLPFALYSCVIEILSGGDACAGIHASIHGTAADLINRFGTEALKERLLPDMASGKKVGCLVFTEASGGSDLKAISTVSELSRDGYIMNGNKFAITSGAYADVHVVFTVDKEDYHLPFAGRKKYNALVVEKGTVGLELLGIGNTMGWRASPTSMLKFADCKVPAENLLDERGSGRKVVSAGLSGGRISFGCAWSLGIADAAYRKAMERSEKRMAFGKPLKAQWEIRKHLADMYRYLWIGRQKYIYAAYLKDKRDPAFPLEATISKIFCSEMAEDIVKTAYQMHGHFGYINESGIPQLFRDVMVATVGEGGTEVLRDRVVAPGVRNGEYSRTGEIEYDRSYKDRNLGDEIFRELAQRLGDEVYPCYEILVSRATGRKIRMPATEVKHLAINWKLHGL